MRKFYLAAMLLMPFLFLCGCSKDTVSGKPEDLIIGTWGQVYYSGQQIDTNPDDGEDNDYQSGETYYDITDPNIEKYKFDEYGIVYWCNTPDNLFTVVSTYEVVGDRVYINEGEFYITISFHDNDYFEASLRTVYSNYVSVYKIGMQRID